MDEAQEFLKQYSYLQVDLEALINGARNGDIETVENEVKNAQERLSKMKQLLKTLKVRAKELKESDLSNGA